jgi:hypothetical protein
MMAVLGQCATLVQSRGIPSVGLVSGLSFQITHCPPSQKQALVFCKRQVVRVDSILLIEMLLEVSFFEDMLQVFAFLKVARSIVAK